MESEKLEKILKVAGISQYHSQAERMIGTHSVVITELSPGEAHNVRLQYITQDNNLKRYSFNKKNATETIRAYKEMEKTGNSKAKIVAKKELKELKNYHPIAWKKIIC